MQVLWTNYYKKKKGNIMNKMSFIKTYYFNDCYNEYQFQIGVKMWKDRKNCYPYTPLIKFAS